MKIIENPLNQRELVERCIKRYGHTSDHNLDWFVCGITAKDGKAVFIEWPDGSGLLTHRYGKEWRIWSNPLSLESAMVDRIAEFALKIFEDKSIEKVWCDFIDDNIRPALVKMSKFKVNDIYYSLLWPVIDMTFYDPKLPGGRLKDLRHARNKFYREHKVAVKPAQSINKEDLHNIVQRWKNNRKNKDEETYDLWYHCAIDKDFRGFKTARAVMVDGLPVALNAGYEVVNKEERFAGIVGLHDYSSQDLGTIIYLEDLDWIKNAGYKEADMQGSEEDHGLRFKMRFKSTIERKTDTFSIKRLTSS